MLIACEKEAIQIQEPTDLSKNIEGIQVGSENGYLVLNSFEDAIHLAATLETISNEEVVQFCEKYEFISSYLFRKKLNEKFLDSDDDKITQSVLFDLETKGYFDRKTNSLTYPFITKPWSKILNEDGIIKINGTLMRFWNENQICSVSNDFQSLAKANSIEDFQNDNFKIFDARGQFSVEDNFNHLKSIVIPNTSGQLFSTDYFDVINNVGGRDYRRRTNLISLIFRDSNDNVAGHIIYVSHSLSQKILGIWWDYNDYLYYKLFKLTIGGNYKSTDPDFGFHPVTIVNVQYPSTEGGIYQSSEHNYSAYDRAFNPYVSDYLTPNFAIFTYEYWTNKVPSKGWMVF